MQFKKYVKLRKYVNGVPTDEYKKGNLIAVVQADDQNACENGKTN